MDLVGDVVREDGDLVRGDGALLRGDRDLVGDLVEEDGDLVRHRRQRCLPRGDWQAYPAPKTFG